MANSRAYGLLTERQYVVASLSSNGDILDGFTRMSPLRFMKLRVTPSSCQLTSLSTSSAGFSVQSSFLSAFTITAALPLHFALTGTTLFYLLCPWNDSYFLVYFSPIPEGLPRVYDNIFAMGIMVLLHQHATFPMVAPTNAISVVPFPISLAEDSASPFSVM